MKGSSAKKPNIIFMLLDAWRQDHCGCYGYDKPVSPNIDKMAQESVIFKNAFSMGNCTNPCLTAIFSGQSILKHGLIRHMGTEQKEIDDLDKRKVKFLPEILRENGYYTMAFDWLGRWQKRGYDHYSGIGDHKFSISFKVKLPFETADVVVKKAKKHIKENKYKPFFAFLHFWDTHTPYSPPSKFTRKFKKYAYSDKKSKDLPLDWATEWINILTKNANEVFERYDGSIRFVDHQIEKLISFLKKEKLYDNTIIIITADHGENLIDHNIYFGHHGLYDTTLKIPFIARFPDLGYKKIDSSFQQIDFMPTLLNYLNIKCPEVEGKAFDLENDEKNLNKRKEMFFIANEASIIAFRDKDYKYLYEPVSELEELYDLNKDKKEEKNIIEKNRKIAELMRKKTRGIVMAAKKRKEEVYGKNKVVYDRMHYSTIARRNKFLQTKLNEKEKDIENLYRELENSQGKLIVRLKRKWRKIRARLNI